MNGQTCLFELSDSYLKLLAWFMNGIPGPYMKEAYKLNTDTEIVLRKLTESRLTGVELAQRAKGQYRDELPQERTARASA